MNTKKSKLAVSPLPTAEQLRTALSETKDAAVRTRIASLFDEGTFVELGAYVKRSYHEFASVGKDGEFEGVICGYGAVNGALTYAFLQDASRMSGAVDEMHAKKITALYDLAVKNGAPVVGVFASAGADIYEGASALSAYGSIMNAVANASGVVPQIAVVAGTCAASMAAIAAMFDFTVTEKGAKFHVTAPENAGVKNAENAVCAANCESDGLLFARELISRLPSSSSDAISVEDSTDDLNRVLGNVDFGGDALCVLGQVADNGSFLTVGDACGEAAVTALAQVGGVRCGLIVSNYKANEGRIDAATANKLARFVGFCDAFSLPVISLVDSMGLVKETAAQDIPFSAALARLAQAYACASVPKISVVIGHAIGAAFSILGSKAMGADVAYATENAEIGALGAEAAVLFAEEDKITLTTSREELMDAWKQSVASPVAAASRGDVDDIISVNELRQRVCSALMMLASKSTVRCRRHAVRPL